MRDWNEKRLKVAVWTFILRWYSFAFLGKRVTPLHIESLSTPVQIYPQPGFNLSPTGWDDTFVILFIKHINYICRSFNLFCENIFCVINMSLYPSTSISVELCFPKMRFQNDKLYASVLKRSDKLRQNEMVSFWTLQCTLAWVFQYKPHCPCALYNTKYPLNTCL